MVVNEEGIALKEEGCELYDDALAAEKRYAIQEELRLFYVATTRAKRSLLLSCSGAIDQELTETPNSLLWFLQQGIQCETDSDRVFMTGNPGLSFELTRSKEGFNREVEAVSLFT